MNDWILQFKSEYFFFKIGFYRIFKEKNDENQMGALMKSICHLKKPQEEGNGNEVLKSINNYAFMKKNFTLF